MPDSFISVINDFQFLSNEEKCWIKYIWCKWTATFYQCKFYPQGCLPLQCALLPVHPSLLLSSYPLCLLQNGKWRIFWRISYSLPSTNQWQTKSKWPSNNSVIRATAGSCLRQIRPSKGFLSLLSVEVKVSKVTPTRSLVSVLRGKL